MNGPCTLPSTIHVRILPIGTRPVLLCKVGSSIPHVSIREADGPVLGIIRPDGWMLINHPREGVGLVGLPLTGDTGSWEAAFEDELIELERRTHCTQPWEPLEEWNALPLVAATS